MTRRFEEMKAWYSDVFCGEVVHGDPALAFLTYDHDNHRFAIANLDVLKPDTPADSGPGEIGVNHMAYTYASAGTRPHPLLAGSSRLHAFPYYQDPDGNRIELQVESCNSKDAFDYMRSEEFEKKLSGSKWILRRCWHVTARVPAKPS